LIYIEVPLELKDCIPPFQEPVTHINFFSTYSLKAIAELSGLHVLSCVESQFTTEQNTKGFALKLVAHKSDIILNSQSKISPIDKNAYRETLKLIFPSISEKANRFLKDQKYRHRKINEMGKKYLPKKFFWRFFN
ncbi:MAG TPA: hypothetical protein DCZ48_06970, partial [Methylococcaceae bacterium]|nr:hypothetical protein [Methylococcaceae bacterium]